MEYCWNAIRTRSLWQINCLGSYRNMMQFQINSRKQNRQRDTWIIKIRVLEKVFRKQFCFIKCRRQHLQVTELRSYSKFTFAENTNANLPEVLRTKFLGSDGLFCFISTCKFGSFKNPFAMTASLSQGNSSHFLPPVNGGKKLNLRSSFKTQSHMWYFFSANFHL